MPEPETLTEPDSWPDLERLLDQELSRLPDKYRTAIVLCDLEGKARKDVARQLKIPEGTLSSRLTTARTLLAKRLTRHGLAVSAGTLATLLSEKAGSACVPASVLSSTIKAATLLAAGQATVASVTSMSVAGLTEGVLKTMLLTKLKIAAMGLLVVTTIGLGLTIITYRTWASDHASASSEAATKAARDAERPRQNAAREDKLAAKTITRVGTQLLADDRPKAGAEDNEKREKQPEGQDSTKPRLQALLKERLEILKYMAERMKQLHKQNAVGQEAVLQAELRVYKAELDLCQTAKDRIAVLEKIANVYKQKEDRLAQLARTRAASQETVLEARLARLEAEIAIEREKAKLAVSPK